MSDKGYSTIQSDEGQRLLIVDGLADGSNTWVTTLVLVLCTLVGVGMLSLPYALLAGGWVSLFLMTFCCLMSAAGGILLGKIMQKAHDGGMDIVTYSDVGRFAMGRYGEITARISFMSTLTGMGIVFLILLGIMLDELFPQTFFSVRTCGESATALLNRNSWLLIAAGVMMPLAITLRHYGHAKFISYLGLAGSLVTFFVSVSLSLAFFFSDRYTSVHVTTEFFPPKALSLGLSFSIFTLMFSSHANFPSMYSHLAIKSHWNRVIWASSAMCLAIYIPAGVSGYLAYGSHLSSSDPILTVIKTFLPEDSKGRVAEQVLLDIAVMTVIVHLGMAWPILVIPPFLEFERLFGLGDKDSDDLVNVVARLPLKRAIMRVILLIVMAFVGIIFPFFGDFMSFVSAVSITATTFVLPPLFYYAVFRPAGPLALFCLGFLFLFGLFGGGFAVYFSVVKLSDDVQANGNPFDWLHNCTHSS